MGSNGARWSVRIEPAQVQRAVGYFVLWIVWLVAVAILRSDLHASWDEVLVMIVFPLPLIAVYMLLCLIGAGIKMAWLSRISRP